MNDANDRAPVVVLVSANQEWKVVTRYYRPESTEQTPFGECFRRQVGGCEVMFVHGGWGKISAAASTQYAIDRWKPALLVNLGTCGGLAGQIERDTVLLVNETLVYDIYERMGDAEAARAFYSVKNDLSWLREPLPQPVLRARLLSADQDINPDEIGAMKARYQGVAADWETGAIVWVASANGVRCLVLRAVSDLVGEDGGEAYVGDLAVFENAAGRVLTPMLDALPQWLACALA
ncbi:MAG TPA: 5'-methylthioadenosine/S-adenosylhomocysteine nucleosidase [Anaerolineaceae bacterium]|nr:5'-methylthioadenosine/S-adenosylhomocysteine nucleosidase [Anaerolineaceae bacterium]